MLTVVFKTASYFNVIRGTCECPAPSTVKTSDLGAHAFGGGHTCWVAMCVDKLLPGRSWRPDFTVVVSQKDKAEEVSRSPVSSPMEVDQKPDPWAVTKHPSREKLGPGRLLSRSAPILWGIHGKWPRTYLKTTICFVWCWETRTC